MAMATRFAPDRIHDWPPQGEWTYEDWLRLPDDGARYEVIEGVLYVSPPPSVGHQRTVTKLSSRMDRYVEENDLGLVLTAPVGVKLPGRDVPIQPDLLFMRKERLDVVGEDYVRGVPDLVVEVLSPSNWQYDRGKKQDVYREAGVPEYWIVDYRAQTVEVLRLEAGEYVTSGPFRPGAVAHSTTLAGFEVVVETIFAV